MHIHWNWALILTALGAVGAFGMLVLAVGKALANRIDKTSAQNDLQLAQQRRITRDLFGEDPDNPGGPKGPSLREMVMETALNTRTLPDRVAGLESRVGKTEDEISFIKDILLKPGGN